MKRHVEAMVDWQDAGAVAFDYGNNIRQRAFDEGFKRAFDFPGFVPAFIRPQFCVGRGPFRWVALSGDPEDIYRTDAALLEAFPRTRGPQALADHGARTVSNSRVCRRASAGWGWASVTRPG